MSSISFRRPEFRLHLGYPDIILTSGNRTLGRVATAGGFHAALGRLTEAVRRARGRLVVVLPESEVWRGRLDLAGRSRAERRAGARSIVAGRLAEAPGDIVVVLGTRGPGGSFPVAGVRRSTLNEARALLAGLGLRPSAIVGAGLFPGFIAAPRLVGWSLPLPALLQRRRGLGAAIGAGGIVSLAILALGLPAPDAPRSAEAFAPTVVAAADVPAIDLPPVAEVVLPAPPAALALAFAAPPKPRPAATPGEPLVTVAARNMPADLPLVIAPPKPSPARRLADLAAAPAKVLDDITRPLRRPEARSAAAAEREVPDLARTAMPVLPAAAVPAEIRPMHRPKAAAAAPAPVAAGAALAPRPRGATSGTASSSPEPAMLVASLEPAPLMQASIAAATAAAVAAAVAEPPPARPAALVAKPAPVAARPVVVRPKPVAAAPRPAPVQPPVRQVVKQATPARQIVVASATPRRAVVTAMPVAKPAPVRQKVVAKPARKPVPVRTVPVRQAAKQVRQAAPQPVAAVAPMVAAKPATHRVGLSRGNISLVGVFAGADGRHALVRLPNGNIERVKAGDRVQGAQVAAISADSVRLTGRRGKDTLLRLPD